MEMLNENLALTTPDEALEQLIPPAPPVLITENEVALSTAVALQSRSKTRRRWAEATQVLFAALRPTPARSTQDDHRAPRSYPKRYTFLETASMARAMERL
jgi:hypothetical protein